jgi:uncharacterized cupin superfamily protein
LPKIDPALAPTRTGCGYPPPFDAPCMARTRAQLGEAGGLTQFGVNLLRIAPGVWSSQRHNHTHEDEFVMVVEGEVVLVEDAGETVLGAGDFAAFAAGSKDAHHLINRSAVDALVLEVGGRSELDACDYPDIDMIAEPGAVLYSHRDGTPYPQD